MSVGEGWLSLKVRVESIGSIKQGSSAFHQLSVSLADISVLLNASLTANEISRKYEEESLASSFYSFSPCESAVSLFGHREPPSSLLYTIRESITTNIINKPYNTMLPLLHHHVCAHYPNSHTGINTQMPGQIHKRLYLLSYHICLDI